MESRDITNPEKPISLLLQLYRMIRSGWSQLIQRKQVIYGQILKGVVSTRIHLFYYYLVTPKASN